MDVRQVLESTLSPGMSPESGLILALDSLAVDLTAPRVVAPR